MISGLFFGFAFGVAGVGAALLGMLADARGIGFVFQVCAFLPLIGLLAAFLPPDRTLIAALMPERVVIVGAGQGGAQAAASLRQDGFAGALTLIGDEPGLPYQRPPLSKAYMKDGDADRLLLKPAAFYAAHAIDYRPRHARGRDRPRRRPRADRRRRARTPTTTWCSPPARATPRRRSPGSRATPSLGLRTLADAAGAARRASRRCASAVVIGGGFIGLEFAAVARAAGLEVTVLEAADRLMGRVVSPEISRPLPRRARGDGHPRAARRPRRGDRARRGARSPTAPRSPATSSCWRPGCGRTSSSPRPPASRSTTASSSTRGC